MPFCNQCGQEISDNARFCENCGQAVSGEQQPGAYSTQNDQVYEKPSIFQIETHLAKAIAVTILCCLPLGIMAITYAVKVNDKKIAGDYYAAEEASRNADKWANWGFILGIIFGIIYLFFVIMTTMSEFQG